MDAFASSVFVPQGAPLEGACAGTTRRLRRKVFASRTRVPIRGARGATRPTLAIGGALPINLLSPFWLCPGPIVGVHRVPGR